MVIPANKCYELGDSIVPQLFIMRDGEIYFFDKVNQHEGRFYKKDKNGIEGLFEIGEGQGVLNENGDIYTLNIGEKTIINKYYLNGKLEKSIEINGIFFDFKINETGHYICLGYEGGNSIVKIINSDGMELNSIKANNILFATCIYIQGDYIFLGAFNEKNVFKLLQMNYIGNVVKEWTIDVDSEERIISKILVWKDYIFVSISGKRDNLVIINARNNSIKEVFPEDLGLRDFIDMNINKDSILLLNEKCIYEYDIEKLIKTATGKFHKHFKSDISVFPYQYLMCTRRAKEQFIFGTNISALITLALITYFYYKGPAGNVKPSSLALPLFSLFWILAVMIALTKSTVSFINKSTRIEYLLNIHQNNIKRSLLIPAMSAITSFCIISLIFLPDFYIIEGTLTGVFFFIITYLFELISIKRVKNQDKNIVIELLSEEGQFKDYLKAALDSISVKSNEKFYINIIIDGSLKNNVVYRWVNSRKNIIRDEVNVRIDNNKVTTVIDLSKRDVKYSRISILMDYICFLKCFVSIKEIEIGCLEDKG